MGIQVGKVETKKEKRAIKEVKLYRFQRKGVKKEEGK